MKFCKKCKARLSSAAKVCPSCNTPVGGDDADQAAGATATPAAGTREGGKGAAATPPPGTDAGGSAGAAAGATRPAPSGEVPTHPNNAIRFALLALELLKLNRAVYATVAIEEDALEWGGIVVAIGAFAPHLLTLSLVYAFISLFVIPMLWVVFAGVAHGVAVAMGGKGSPLALGRVLGLLSIVLWVGIVPFVGPLLKPLACLAYVFYTAVAVRELHELPMGKAMAAAGAAGAVMALLVLLTWLLHIRPLLEIARLPVIGWTVGH